MKAVPTFGEGILVFTYIARLFLAVGEPCS